MDREGPKNQTEKKTQEKEEGKAGEENFSSLLSLKSLQS